MSPTSKPSLRSRLRALARPVLYPADWLAYRLYATFRRGRVAAGPLEIARDARRILVLSPHQDDELLGCGGAIIRFRGDRTVQVAFMSDGKGRAHRSADEQAALADMRVREARAVCAALGVEPPVFLGLADGSLTGNPLLAEGMEELVRRFRPDVVFAPFVTDAHDDHVATAKALAGLPGDLLGGLRILLYQVHSHLPDALLNRYLPLTGREEAEKVAALRLYESQDMRRELTLDKYMMFSRTYPQLARQAGATSVEHFVEVNPAELVGLAGRMGGFPPEGPLRSINYSPFSFAGFRRNDRVLAGLFRQDA